MVYVSYELTRSLTIAFVIDIHRMDDKTGALHRADLFFEGTLAKMKPYGLVQQYADSRVDAVTARRMGGRDTHLCEELTSGQGVHMLTYSKVVDNTPGTRTPLC